jgi:hypothetical protein
MQQQQFPTLANSYALDELNGANALVKQKQKKEEEEEEEQLGRVRLPIFSLNELNDAKRRRKRNSTDNESFAGTDDEDDRKYYGQVISGCATNDRVYYGTTLGSVKKIDFLNARRMTLRRPGGSIVLNDEEDLELDFRGEEMDAMGEGDRERDYDSDVRGTASAAAAQASTTNSAVSAFAKLKDNFQIGQSRVEVSKICAKGDSCVFALRDRKTGKVYETHYLGENFERSKPVMKLRGQSVSAICFVVHEKKKAKSSSDKNDKNDDDSDESDDSDDSDENENENEIKDDDDDDDDEDVVAPAFSGEYYLDDDDDAEQIRNSNYNKNKNNDSNNTSKKKHAKKNKKEEKTKTKREFLIGTSTGSILYLELEEDNKDWKKMREVKCLSVLDIPKEGGLREPIVGVKLYSTITSNSSSSSSASMIGELVAEKSSLSKLLNKTKATSTKTTKNNENRKFYSLMIATPSRLFFVKKEARSIEDFFKELEKAENQTLLEPVVRMPIRATFSTLTTKRNMQTDEIIFAWLTGAGVYAGSADASPRETGNQAKLLRDHSLLPFPTKNALRKKEDSSPIGLALTDHHAVLAYSDRIACVSRLTGELAQLLRLDETADGVVTRESLIAPKVVFCATDDITGVSYLCKDDGALSEIASRDEARDAWRYYCERHEYSKALICAGNDARRRFEINKAKAEKAFKDREYEVAGQAWSECEEMIPFERIAKKFKDASSLNGLISYCVGRFEKLNKSPLSSEVTAILDMKAMTTMNNKTSSSSKDSKKNVYSSSAGSSGVVDEDATKRSMLANFLVDLHLSAIQRAKGKQILESRLKFSAFLRQFKKDIDTQLTKKKIEKSGDRDLEISFASAQGEHEKVVAYFLDEKRDIDLTLDALENFEVPSELICDSVEKLFELDSEKTTDFLIAQGTRRIEPKRVLYAFTPFVGSKDKIAVENAIRYLRRACSNPNISTSSARDLASHNLLTTLYVEALANKFRDNLFSELESYLREAVRTEEVETFGTANDDFFNEVVSAAAAASSNNNNNATTTTSNKKNQYAYYDPRYALTLLESRVDKKLAYKCIAFLHCLLKEYEEAIRAALEHGNDVELAKIIADAPVSNAYDFDGGINHAYFGVGKDDESMLMKEMEKKMSLKNDDNDSDSNYSDLSSEDSDDIEREETAHLRRKTLWLEIAKHVIDNHSSNATIDDDDEEQSLVEQKVKLALDFLEETTKDNNVRAVGDDDGGEEKKKRSDDSRILGVEDILPLLPDFTKIDAVRDAVLEALHKYQNSIEAMKKDIERDSEITAKIREEVREIESKDLEISADEPCATCKKPVLRNGKVPDSSDCTKLAPFYAFPCTHAFHCACLLREALPLMLDDERNTCLSLMKCLKIPLPIRLKPKVKLWGPPPKTATGLTSERAVEKLEDVLCHECPMCGIMRTRIISQPLFQLPEEQEDYDIFHFEDKYTWKFEDDALTYVTADGFEEKPEEDEDIYEIVNGHKVYLNAYEVFDERDGLPPFKHTWNQYSFVDSDSD